MSQLEELNVQALLQQYVLIIEELQRRKIVRTGNSPLGDYTEWIVSQKLSLTLSDNSTAGYDATSLDGTRYQIKSRRVHASNNSRQLSPIRELGAKRFDFLIAVIFNPDFSIQQAIQVPHAVIEEYASYRAHINGHILHVRGPILDDIRVQDLTKILN